MTDKRIVILVGHYGSGKTNIAVNLAKYYRSCGEKVAIADMDIVNPYFRTIDSTNELHQMGINVVASPYAGTNIDAPALPASFYGLFENRTQRVILDIGGDDRGAVVLGRYVSNILQENNYEFIFVANAYRALTPRPEDAYKIMREIEIAGGLNVTAIINNSHLIEDTTLDTISDSFKYTDELSRISKKNVIATCIKNDLFNAAEKRWPDIKLFPLQLQEKYYQ